MRDKLTALTAKILYDGSNLIDDPVVCVEDGRIASISTRSAAPLPTGARVLEFAGAMLAPSFFDVHIHGAAGHDVMEATPEALGTIAGFLAARGTGSILATTVTAPLDATLRAVEGLAKLIAGPAKEGSTRLLGIHLEGPFLSYAKRGVQPAEHLLAPNISAFDKLVEAGQGHVRLMTLAPELPGAAELAAHAAERGVRISLGHSNATAAETRAAIAAGAVSATHTFNAMRSMDHREPGIVGTVLTDDSLYSELICDGVHSAPEISRLWWRAKGQSRGILVTDAMSATGMPDGEYDLGGSAVQVVHGCAMRDGVLAGSLLTLDRALSNFVAFTGARLEQGLRLMTANPATMVGLESEAGFLTPGCAANLVVVGPDGKLMASFVDGLRANGPQN
jgi:N-acetylglucosamine-6-phosphate deacetylase